MLQANFRYRVFYMHDASFIGHIILKLKLQVSMQTRSLYIF